MNDYQELLLEKIARSLDNIAIAANIIIGASIVFLFVSLVAWAKDFFLY